VAQELVIRGAVYFLDGLGSPAEVLEVLGKYIDITTKIKSRFTVSVAVTTTALPLGGVTSPGAFILVNRDATNFVELQLGAGGSKFAKLLPGVPCVGCFPSTVTAPHAIADTLACVVEGLIVSN
jgi:hypothetical protein